MDISDFLAKHQLPISYQQQCEQFFIPVAKNILHAKKTILRYLLLLMAAKARVKPPWLIF